MKKLFISIVMLTSILVLQADNRGQKISAATTNRTTRQANPVVLFSNLVAATNGNIQQAATQLFSQNQNVVLYFFGLRCPFCKNFDTIFQEVANARPSIKFVKVDASQYPIIAQQYGNAPITQVPTLRFVKNGAFVGQYGGGKVASQILAAIQQHFGI